jgi:tetratricopeptide (TPR) repeat protein
MLIPFILSVIAWPIVTFLSIFLVSKLLMPFFMRRITIGYKRADIFQALTLMGSQVIVVLVAKGIYNLFQHQATPWLAVPFGLWCFAFGPMAGPIDDHLKAKYEGKTTGSLVKHIGWSWAVGLGVGWIISTILLFVSNQTTSAILIILEFIAVLIAAFTVLWVFLGWICEKHPKWRNFTGFMVELGSAYSASFVFDMLTQVGIGRLQFGGVITPVFTWTGMAIACHMLASNVAISIRALYIPYLIFGGIAIFATIAKWHNIFIALPLLIVALIIFLLETSIMAFFSKKIAEYWIGVTSKYLKAGEPEKALNAVSHLYKFQHKKEQESQSIYGLAAFLSGQAYVALNDWANARFWLDNCEATNPPNKKWLDDLRREVEKLEAESKKNYQTTVEIMKASWGEEGVWLGRGFDDLNRGMNDQAIKAFNEVLKSCGLPDSKMRAKELQEYDQRVFFALLGLVLAYSGLAQLDKAKEYLEILDHINPDMAEDFRETWKKSPPHI